MAEQAAASGLQVEVHGDGAEVELLCTGRLVIGTTDVLYSKVHEVLPEAKRILIDCAQISRMDSSGLGILVRLYVQAKGKGCTLELVNMGPSIRHLLGITQLMGVLTTIGENNIRIV
jgi:anti-anti-sigma factor